jgi:hypothetical protein
MVTAIVIPILIIYFYWVAKKEAAYQRKKWESLTSVSLEARIQGEIIHIQSEKKRFHHQLFMMVTTIQVKENNDKLHTVLLREPLTPSWSLPVYRIGDSIQILGRWDTGVFHAGEIITVKAT